MKQNILFSLLLLSLLVAVTPTPTPPTCDSNTFLAYYYDLADVNKLNKISFCMVNTYGGKALYNGDTRSLPGGCIDNTYIHNSTSDLYSCAQCNSVTQDDPEYVGFTFRRISV